MTSFIIQSTYIDIVGKRMTAIIFRYEKYAYHRVTIIFKLKIRRLVKMQDNYRCNGDASLFVYFLGKNTQATA